MEDALLKTPAGAVSVAQQRALATRPALHSSVQARCQTLDLSRSSPCYQPCGESAYGPELTRLTDEEFTQHNPRGMLDLRDHLRLVGHTVTRKHVRRLMRLMGHGSICPKLRLRVPYQEVTRA